MTRQASRDVLRFDGYSRSFLKKLTENISLHFIFHFSPNFIIPRFHLYPDRIRNTNFYLNIHVFRVVRFTPKDTDCSRYIDSSRMIDTFK